MPLWVSVGGFAASDYAELCACARRPRRGDDDRAQPLLPERRGSARERGRARRRGPPADPKPLYAKLSPAATDLPETARAVQAAGADGLSLVNTIRGLALDEKTLQPVLGHELGGYSGPALKPIALAAVYQCYRRDRRCRSSAWAGSPPGATRSSFSLPARARSRSERSFSPTPMHPAECAESLPRSSLPAGSPGRRTHRGLAHREEPATVA